MSQKVMMFLAAACLALPAGCKTKPSGQPARPQVVVSLYWIQDVVRELAGDDLAVDCLVTPGAISHNVEFKPAQAEALARANLAIVVGLGVDEYANRGIQAAGKGDLKVLTLSEDPKFKERLRQLYADNPPPAEADEDEDDHGHAHGAGAINPHVWLDPVFMQDFVAAVADALVELDKAHRDDYLRRRDAYIQKLKDLDRDYRAELAPFAGKTIVTYHAAYSYMARRYGLVQVSLHNATGGGLDSQRLEGVLAVLRQNKTRAIFVEPQYPRERLADLSKQYGVRIGVLDSEGNPNTPGYNTYLSMMRSNLKNLADNLKD